MSQQPFQTWQGQLWNHQQQEESVQQQQQHQQRYRNTLTYPASYTTYQQPTQQEYIDGSLTHRLSQYPYSRQQTPFTSMQPVHQLDRQNSVQDMFGVVPIERSEYAQLQVCIFGLL